MPKTIFNINKQHVLIIKSLFNPIKANRDEVIIHGDGMVFACNYDQKAEVRTESGKKEMTIAQKDSLHHSTYNSGFNEYEKTANAKYRAVYHKGDKLPDTPDDIINAFFKRTQEDLKEKTGMKEAPISNILSLDDETDILQATPEVKADSEKDNLRNAEAEPKKEEQPDPEVKAEEKVIKKGGRPKIK
jgi:hypothetical protein